ncbi:MAG TPA: RNA methyltransferase [Myxococcaceae bacterium]|nr:RNA methyltransferase [Myxococcaceae bacterium]
MASSASEELFLPTTPGLEPALEGEARGLGWKVERTDGGLTARGPAGLHQDACLWLRTASRVLLRVATVPAPDAASLSRALGKVSLAAYRDGARGAEVQVSTRRSKLRAPQVEEAARKAWRLPPAQGEDLLRLQLRVDGDGCTVSVDCGGELLYRRGYRQETSHAPLRETLGAGMLLLAGYTGDEPLWDPMCGSGTLPIEGALMALRRAPGRDRRFAFQDFPGFDAPRWEETLARARQGERAKPPAPLLASDLNAGALGVARRNARRAGVLEMLKLERLDAMKLQPPPDTAPGLLVANLPYGKRVGESAGLMPLYRGFGEALRQGFRGWRAALLLERAPALESALGLTAERVFELDNGGLHCRLLVCPIR